MKDLMEDFRTPERIEVSPEKPHTKQERMLFRIIFILASLLYISQMNCCLSELSPKFRNIPQICHALYVIVTTLLCWKSAEWAVKKIKKGLPSIVFAEETGYSKTKNSVILITGYTALSITGVVVTFCALEIIDKML